MRELGIHPQTPLRVNPIANVEAQMIAQDIRALEPEKPQTPAELDSTAKYLFRTDPGFRNLTIRIPGVPNFRDERKQAYSERVYERKYKWFLVDPFAAGAPVEGFEHVAALPLPESLRQPPVQVYRVVAPAEGGG